MTPEQAKALCIKAHGGQWRRPNKVKTKEALELKTKGFEIESFSVDGYCFVREPYSSHPIAVAKMLTTDDEKVLAYLHDVVEDTNYTYERLLDLGLDQLSDTARNAFKLLTKQPDQSYKLYIFNITCCSLARKVKLADMFHNISSNPTDKAKAKYFKGVKYLLASL